MASGIEISSDSPPTAIILPSGRVLTPEEITKQRLRKEAKKAQAAAKRAAEGAEEVKKDDGGGIKQRKWIEISERGDLGRGSGLKFKVLTFNMLAQTLVRRELFPGSDCLKWKDRHSPLTAELLQYVTPSSILCLQECDQLDWVKAAFPRAGDQEGGGWTHVDSKGRGKKHGLVIMFNSALWTLKGQKTIYLDEEELLSSPASSTSPISATNGSTSLSPSESEETQRRLSKRKARAGTRQTKNIGLMVLLESKIAGKDGKKRGLVVGTTHLFWHPHYTYERTRQALILSRKALEYRDSHDKDWPVILAGDFNTSPSEPTYHLLTNPYIPLPQSAVQAVTISQAIHTSLENVEAALYPANVVEEGEGAEEGNDNATGAKGKGKGPPPMVLGDRDDEKEEDEGGGGEGEGEGGGGGGKDSPENMKNTRSPVESDGLPTPADLQTLAQGIFGSGSGPGSGSLSHASDETIGSGAPEGEGAGAKSAYGSSGWQDQGEGHAQLTFGSRWDGEKTFGENEPNWTSYTPLWHLTLDYILELVPSNAPNALTPLQILAPHKTEDLDPGLPRKKICASDHVLLGVEYELP